MSQADAETTSIELTKKGEAAVADGILARERAIAEKRALRKEAAAEVIRLLAFLDRLDGDPDLEPEEDEATLAGSEDDGEVEMSLGWTDAVNQDSPNRLGGIDGNEDYEQDDCDDEPSLAGAGGSQNMTRSEVDLEQDTGDDEDGGDEEAAVAPSPAYTKRLRARRPRRTGLRNVWPLDGEATIIGPGKLWIPERGTNS